MRCEWPPVRPGHRVPSRLFCACLLGSIVAWAPASLSAQQPLANQLPNPRLFTLFPSGGKVGTSVEVSFTGTDLEEPQALYFSHPGIKAEPVLPPPPPPPDPKKPAPKDAPPAPKPVISKFKVTIAPDVPLGAHDVRLVNKWGISNPRAFAVGDLLEVLEKEPNNEVEQAQRVELNSTINGNLASNIDVDYFVFTGKKDQRIIVSCLASSIDSRMQPALELYDSAGRQLAFNRHYQGEDALLDCTLPADGDYYVRLCEFSYIVGNAEHFYRLTISTAPWIDAVFPTVVEPGKPATLTVFGRNLPGSKLDPSAVIEGRVLEKATVNINVPADPGALERLAYGGHLSPISSALEGFEYRLRNPVGASNPFLLTYARAPVALSNGANHSADTAQEVPLPCEIAGWIDKPGERDWYTFTAKKGDIYSIEVLSERLGAPTDLVFTFRNPATKQEQEFDDNPDTLSPFKFVTRSSDPPRYRFVAPADGKFQIMVRNQEAGAGPRHFYRIGITPEKPDFRLIVMHGANNAPDACRLLQGGNQHFTVLLWRMDGFNGTVTVTAEGLPSGVTCPPQSIGPGVRQAALVLSAAASAPLGTYEFKLKGTATIKVQPVIHEARPASITWPVQPQNNIPVLSRLDRGLVLAVREQAPFNLVATIDKPAVVQGDKANLKLKLARLWPDFKTPLQVLSLDPVPNLVINNNQPLTMAPGKDEATAVIAVNANVAPGTYNLVLRGSAQVPFNKDPMAKQKPNINVTLAATPVTLIVLPKQLATVAVSNANPTAKVGALSELAVKVTRMHDFEGEFKVQLVLPPTAKGLSAEEVTIPAGQNEAKLVIKVAPDAAPGNRPDLIVRATGLFNGSVPTAQETKIAVNVTK